VSGGFSLISEFLGMLLRGAYLTFHRRMQSHFSRYGVTADQFVLLALLAQEHDITQRRLAQYSYSDANTITAILNRLEQKKLVERKRCQSDRRVRRILLTAKGRRLHARLQRSVSKDHRRMEETVPAGERKRVKQWLHHVIAEMRLAPPPPARKTSIRRSS
jgi:DNA-binding MarR family transcriptional regulator